MRESLLDFLVDPVSRASLALEVDRASDGDDIQEGTLRASDGRSYRVSNGIPRFVLTEDEKQLQSAKSFGYKWKQQKSYGSAGSQEFVANWLVQRYGFQNRKEAMPYLGIKPGKYDLQRFIYFYCATCSRIRQNSGVSHPSST